MSKDYLQDLEKQDTSLSKKFEEITAQNKVIMTVTLFNALSLSTIIWNQ